MTVLKASSIVAAGGSAEPYISENKMTFFKRREDKQEWINFSVSFRKPLPVKSFSGAKNNYSFI